MWTIFYCNWNLVFLNASFAGSDRLSFFFWGILIESQFVPACDAFIAAVLLNCDAGAHHEGTQGMYSCHATWRVQDDSRIFRRHEEILNSAIHC